MSATPSLEITHSSSLLNLGAGAGRTGVQDGVCPVLDEAGVQHVRRLGQAQRHVRARARRRHICARPCAAMRSSLPAPPEAAGQCEQTAQADLRNLSGCHSTWAHRRPVHVAASPSEQSKQRRAPLLKAAGVASQRRSNGGQARLQTSSWRRPRQACWPAPGRPAPSRRGAQRPAETRRTSPTLSSGRQCPHTLWRWPDARMAARTTGRLQARAPAPRPRAAQRMHAHSPAVGLRAPGADQVRERSLLRGLLAGAAPRGRACSPALAAPRRCTGL